MDTKRLVVGTLVGGIAVFALGYLIFDLLFATFYAANVGSATGVERSPQLLWAVALGALSYAALIMLALKSRAGSTSVATAAQIGAGVGFLLWFTVDFTLYGTTNISNLTRTAVDPLLELIRGGIAGGVIAAVLGKVR